MVSLFSFWSSNYLINYYIGKYGHTEKEVVAYFTNLSLDQFANVLESSVEDAKSIYDEARKQLGLGIPLFPIPLTHPPAHPLAHPLTPHPLAHPHTHS